VNISGAQRRARIALEKENTAKTVKENPDFRHTSSPPKKKRKSSATPNK
jgi:hypothetical protein